MNRLFNINFSYSLLAISTILVYCNKINVDYEDLISPYPLPKMGLCAHRGAMKTHPENTIAAFKEAIKRGAHMIEFDVQLSKDNVPVVIHDYTVDRTTNGTGFVSDLYFEELRKLDAGSWKSQEFTDERIPTLLETLQVMPVNIWLNIHVYDTRTAAIVINTLISEDRLYQAFLACEYDIAKFARSIHPKVMICNMSRRITNLQYVNETIELKATFIQFLQNVYPSYVDYIRVLKDNNIKINFSATDSHDKIKTLYEYGVEFILVDDIANSMEFVSQLGIHPVEGLFR